MIRFNPFTGTLDYTGGGGAWEKASSTVTASSTGVIDTVANTAFESLKYIISIFNSANTSYRSLEISILNANGGYKETRNARLQDNGPNVAINTINNAGNLELQVVNNESYDIQVTIGKITLS